MSLFLVSVPYFSKMKHNFNCALISRACGTSVMGNDSFCNIPAPVTFHECHGRNIILSENNTVAYRQSGYAYGLTFSDKPLLPGEIFLLEIEKIEHGWSGNLRCGLTQQNPSSSELPQFALPDLVDGGKSWIFKISSDMSAFQHTNVNKLYPTIYKSNNLIHTSKGSIPVSALQPSRQKYLYSSVSDDESADCVSLFHSEEDDEDEQYLYPAEVGSRIGVTYVIHDNLAEVYLFLNGDIYGPCATGIPYKNSPIFAVIDLYGKTKQVRIIQTFGIPSLKFACRDKILQRVSHSKVFHLPLPKSLIHFLTYKS